MTSDLFRQLFRRSAMGLCRKPVLLNIPTRELMIDWYYPRVR